MQAIIVDDEQQSHDVLITFLTKSHPDIKVVASGYSVEEGLKLITTHQPDLVFLDIEMPDGTGFDLLKKFDRPDFHIIFITAYNKYAQEAIGFGALYFLEKPIGKELFDKAIARVHEKQEEKATIEQWRLAYEAFQQLRQEQLPKRTMVSTMEGIHIILVDDIIRFEANGNMSNIHINGREKAIMVSNNIGDYEKQFASYPNFMRVHRSHLVNLDHVSMYARSGGGYLVMKEGEEVGVSRKYREKVLQRLGDG